MKAWEMHHPFCIGVTELVGSKVFFPTGEHGNDPASRKWSVLLFPRADVVRGELGIGIGLGLGPDIDDREGTVEVGDG